MARNTKKEAGISSDKLHRFYLKRSWDSDKDTLGWIMLNPSTADSKVDDPTVRKCVGFAKRWGYGSILIGNLFSYRSPSPRLLKALLQKDTNCDEADEELVSMIRSCSKVVVGWGANGQFYAGRVSEVRDLILSSGVESVSLGTTMAGHPKHPLYVPYVVKTEAWP